MNKSKLWYFASSKGCDHDEANAFVEYMIQNRFNELSEAMWDFKYLAWSKTRYSK